MSLARLIRGVGNQHRWYDNLCAASFNESWSTGLSSASGLSLNSVAFSYGPLLQQEALTVAARLSWLALVPRNWDTMNKGQRIDAIIEIAKESLSVGHAEAARLAIYLDQMLDRLAVVRVDLSLTGRDRAALLDRCGGRCGICGRVFGLQEKVLFMDGKAPRQGVSPRNVHDRWKPIFLSANGWYIEVDHCAPVSSTGDNRPDNLQLSCRYCNNIKRERVSIFDFPRVLRPQLSESAWQFQALRLIASARCFKCGETVTTKELTVGLLSHAAVPSLQNFFVTCYACDPQSAERFVTAAA